MRQHFEFSYELFLFEFFEKFGTYVLQPDDPLFIAANNDRLIPDRQFPTILLLFLKFWNKDSDIHLKSALNIRLQVII